MDRHPAACRHARVLLASDPLAKLNPDMPTKSARKPASQARLERENTQDEIYEKIYVAILEHRLHPGTKLGEERLAEIFGASRARIREVLRGSRTSRSSSSIRSAAPMLPSPRSSKRSMCSKPAGSSSRPCCAG